jgi:hypothetical protein
MLVTLPVLIAVHNIHRRGPKKYSGMEGILLTVFITILIISPVIVGLYLIESIILM